MHRGFGTLGVAYTVIVGLYAGAMYFASDRSITGDIDLFATNVIDAARERGWLNEGSPPDDARAVAEALRPAIAPQDAPSVPTAAERAEAQIAAAEATPQAAIDAMENALADRERRPVEFTEVYYAPIAAAELRLDVESRLRDRLTSDLFAEFDLFLYVSKAVDGPWAQTMYVFEKDGGALDLLHSWPVSTGRERNETAPSGRLVNSGTPAGYFHFDRGRMFRHYRSVQWDAPMPNAMFFNWMDRGRLTGIAIHSATGGGISHLGSRASAGCICLSPEASATLFQLVREEFRGAAPAFAYNARTASSSREGELARRSDGALEYTEGYRVLVIVDTFGGGGDDEPIF